MSEDETASSNEGDASEQEDEPIAPPKKRARAKSPKVTKTKKVDDADDGKKKKRAKKRSSSSSNNPKVIEMVVEAIQELADGERKGSSVAAIKGFILDHYKIRPDMMKHVLKRALKNGLEDKTIARPSSQAEKAKLTFLNGRYIMGKEKASDEASKTTRVRPASLRQLNPVKPKKGKKKKKRARR